MIKYLYAALAAAFYAALPVHADTPAPIPEFQSKRVSVPKAGAGRRIDIQIDPALAFIQPLPSQGRDGANEVVEEVAAAAPTTEAPVGSHSWFWAEVAPEIDANGAQRSLDAVEALEKVAGGARDVPAPRAQDLRLLIQTYGTEIMLKSLETKVSPALALAVMAVESSGRADVVSSAGAKGLMQLMPATAERFGVTDTTASENIRGGIEYLDWLVRHFDNDPILALAGYNAGEGAVAEHGGVPPYAETRDYVPKVLAAWRVARLLCQTPPAFLEDGCVFEGKLTPL